MLSVTYTDKVVELFWNLIIFVWAKFSFRIILLLSIIYHNNKFPEWSEGKSSNIICKKITKDAMLIGIIIFSIVTLVTLYLLIGARQS